MKTSDSNLKANRNAYPDAVTCDRVRLIGLLTIVYLKSPNEKTSKQWLIGQLDASYHM